MRSGVVPGTGVPSTSTLAPVGSESSSTSKVGVRPSTAARMVPRSSATPSSATSFQAVVRAGGGGRTAAVVTEGTASIGSSGRVPFRHSGTCSSSARGSLTSWPSASSSGSKRNDMKSPSVGGRGPSACSASASACSIS